MRTRDLPRIDTAKSGSPSARGYLQQLIDSPPQASPQQAPPAQSNFTAQRPCILLSAAPQRQQLLGASQRILRSTEAVFVQSFDTSNVALRSGEVTSDSEQSSPETQHPNSNAPVIGSLSEIVPGARYVGSSFEAIPTTQIMQAGAPWSNGITPPNQRPGFIVRTASDNGLRYEPAQGNPGSATSKQASSVPPPCLDTYEFPERAGLKPPQDSSDEIKISCTDLADSTPRAEQALDQPLLQDDGVDELPIVSAEGSIGAVPTLPTLEADSVVPQTDSQNVDESTVVEVASDNNTDAHRALSGGQQLSAISNNQTSMESVLAGRLPPLLPSRPRTPPSLIRPKTPTALPALRR